MLCLIACVRGFPKVCGCVFVVWLYKGQPREDVLEDVLLLCFDEAIDPDQVHSLCHGDACGWDWREGVGEVLVHDAEVHTSVGEFIHWG